MEERRFKLPEIRKPANPLTSQGAKALGIVLAAVVLISGVAYFGLIWQGKKGPSVLPATTVGEEEVTIESEPTEIPTIVPTEEPMPTLEETLTSTASPTATVAPTLIVSPTVTESAPTD